MYSGHPRNLDQVACDFPELRIVAMNPGFPVVNELGAVAWASSELLYSNFRRAAQIFRYA
jgi:predicted TIM-barrel fold metal-dependent hydrolase